MILLCLKLILHSPRSLALDNVVEGNERVCEPLLILEVELIFFDVLDPVPFGGLVSGLFYLDSFGSFYLHFFLVVGTSQDGWLFKQWRFKTLEKYLQLRCSQRICPAGIALLRPPSYP